MCIYEKGGDGWRFFLFCVCGCMWSSVLEGFFLLFLSRSSPLNIVACSLWLQYTVCHTSYSGGTVQGNISVTVDFCLFPFASALFRF